MGGDDAEKVRSGGGAMCVLAVFLEGAARLDVNSCT